MDSCCIFPMLEGEYASWKLNSLRLGQLVHRIKPMCREFACLQAIRHLSRRNTDDPHDILPTQFRYQIFCIHNRSICSVDLNLSTSSRIFFSESLNCVTRKHAEKRPNR